MSAKNEVVEKELSAYDYPNDKISIANADEVITNHEEPAKAVRSKKNASVVVAANMLKKGEGDAMLSMGNTRCALSVGIAYCRKNKGDFKTCTCNTSAECKMDRNAHRRRCKYKLQT